MIVASIIGQHMAITSFYVQFKDYKMNIIPVFNFNSNELIRFKDQYLIDEHYTFKYLEYHWYNSLPVIVKDIRKVWIKSGIQYIVNHGNFKTLEASLEYQQNTNSEVI